MEARRRGVKRLAGALLTAAACGACAHDTWFAPSRAPVQGQLRLELATGNRYPIQEVNPGAASLVSAECADAQGRRTTLQAVESPVNWLGLRSRGADALSCWAELKPFDIVLEPRLVQVYLDEIRASASVREAATRQRERGISWRENYRKFARIELQSQSAAERKPVGLPLELVVVGNMPLRSGTPLQVQLLRDGKPLPGFPIELVSDRSRLGVWRETDGEGSISHVLPFAGRWLLRGTEVRLAEDGEHWTSRFVTLAIEVD